MEDPFIFSHKRRDEIVWMSQNTNHLPTTPAIDEAMLEAVRSREYSLYPYAKGVLGLREALLMDLGLEEGFEAHVTCGGIEALYMMNRALLSPGDEVIATDPSFLPIHHQVSLSESEPVELPVYQAPWKMTLDQINDALTDRTRAILLIDPLNPLGTSYSREEVRGICELASDNDLLVIDDITYRDFADEHSLSTEFYPEGSVLIYSFSKNCGLAGMRIGGLVALPELMGKMMPYNTNVLSANVLAQRAALAALETKREWIGSVVETSRRNQAAIKSCIDGIDGAFIPVYPSYANMLVVDISGTGARPQDVQDRLLYEHKVFVRSGTYVSKRFGDRFIRVSFTVPEAGVRRFCEALPVVMDELG